MASQEGSANLTCEEMLIEICLLSFFLWWWDSALLQNSGLVLAGFSGCGAFPRGAQHVSGLSPELAVSRVQENNHRGWGKNGAWNKFEEYIRESGGLCRRQEWRRLSTYKPDGNSTIALLPMGAASLWTPFPSWEPSFRITEGVPLLVFQLPLIKRFCFCISLSSSALQAINKHKLIPNSPSPCCR